jgi:predicted adenine nucleotide alpha hydrolase (AANH) superfamily ATPase
MKLLLHACCAPCLAGCLVALGEEGLEPVLFWYNPNIHPYTEYRARRDSFRRFVKEKRFCFFENDEYGLRPFLEGIFPLQGGFQGKAGDSGGRCDFCYRLRLERTAAFAAENNFSAFSTTLLISPFQEHRLLIRLGEEIGARYGIDFYYRDFRPYFREGQRRARAEEYYMQKYCGCIFSEEERYTNRAADNNRKQDADGRPLPSV